MTNSVDDFRDCKKVENEIQLLTCPYCFDVKKAPDNLQTELINLQCHKELKEQFISAKCADYFRTLYAITNTAISKTPEIRCYQFLCVRTTVNKFFNEVEQIRFKETDDR
jgi:hypothetical protein